MNGPTEHAASPTPDRAAAPRGFGRRPAAGAVSPASRIVSPAAPLSSHTPMRRITPSAIVAEAGASAHETPAVNALPITVSPPARETFDPPPLPPIAPPAATKPPPNPHARKRRMILMFLLTLGLGGLYLMQSARASAPDCGGADATRLLRETMRDRLAKQNLTARQIEFAEMASMISDDHGADACRAVLVVDGQPSANLVYRLSLKLRLIVYNRYALELLGETEI